MDSLNLTGKVGLVTGAGQGVGRQIAIDLAGHGARAVVVNDYYLARAEAVAREIAASGGAAIPFQADVTDHAAVKRMVAEVADRFGAVDILVNNAGNEGAHPGAGEPKPFWETGPDDWKRFTAVNLDGVFNCVSLVTPAMIQKGGGRIITIISDAGRVGESGLEIYSGAKAGAAGFMRAVARTLGRFNITANCVAIAATETPTVAPQLAALPPERRKKMLERYVIRRFGQPGDIAGVVLLLASDAGSWITGQTYPVNGGFSFGM